MMAALGHLRRDIDSLQRSACITMQA